MTKPIPKLNPEMSSIDSEMERFFREGSELESQGKLDDAAIKRIDDQMRALSERLDKHAEGQHAEGHNMPRVRSHNMPRVKHAEGHKHAEGQVLQYSTLAIHPFSLDLCRHHASDARGVHHLFAYVGAGKQAGVVGSIKFRSTMI